MIKNCHMRHENGNCLPAGGFCTANKNICEALHNAYEMGKSERRIGKWVFKNDLVAIPTGYYECSECKIGRLMYEENFCPNCGAKMKV